MAGRVVAAKSSSRRQGSTRSSQYSTSRNASRSTQGLRMSLSDRSSLYRFTNRSDPGIIAYISPTEKINESPPALLVAKAEMGEIMWKSTPSFFNRRKHRKRFFWVHPRSKTIHWNSSDSIGSSRWSKGAPMVGVGVVKRPNSRKLAAAHNFSILIKTLTKDIQITANNRESHDNWLVALRQVIYNNTLPIANPDEPPHTA